MHYRIAAGRFWSNKALLPATLSYLIVTVTVAIACKNFLPYQSQSVADLQVLCKPPVCIMKDG